MVGISAVAHYIINVCRKFLCSNSPPYLNHKLTIVVVTEAGPSAFANIKQNYYYVFIGCCVVYFVLIYLYFP